MRNRMLVLPLAALLAGGLAVSPVEAQGNGRGQSQRELRDDRREQPRFERRDDRHDDRRGDARQPQARRNVPPGWCIGRGNPHNTPANCGYRDARGRDVRHDTRHERNSRNAGNYDSAHRAFHREHDAWCRARASERRYDLRWQARVRLECQQAHDRFHREWGVAHR